MYTYIIFTFQVLVQYSILFLSDLRYILFGFEKKKTLENQGMSSEKVKFDVAVRKNLLFDGGGPEIFECGTQILKIVLA